jgi:hypothetical protein
MEQKMKRIPAQTNIGGTKYKTTYVSKLKDGEGVELMGQLDPIKEEISLLKNMGKTVREKVWFHEMLHGVCKEINLRLTENETDNLANILHDTLHRNKIDCSI